MLRIFLAASLLLISAVSCAEFDGSCFTESDLYGFSPRSLQKQELSDARTLFRRNMVEQDSRPDAFRICQNDGKLESVQIRIQSSLTGSSDWLNVIGDQDY